MNFHPITQAKPLFRVVAPGLVALLLVASACAQSQAAEPATFCRFVPERSDDFAWENDQVAFRVYGPALAKGVENSGVDCWAKRVNYPIIDKWYRLDLEKKQSYHADHGEGLDFYHVGKSRGCGGTAIWHQGKMVLSNVYKAWKILETAPKKSVFQLTYEYDLENRKIQEVKTITIELGERFFKSESAFAENGIPADLEVAVGLTTHDQRGVATLKPDAGWMSVWEDHHGKNGKLGTGVAMDPARIIGMQEIKSKTGDESHVIVTTRTDANGRTVHYAGYGWDQAGEITAPEQWAAYLKAFAASLPHDARERHVDAAGENKKWK